MVAKKRNAAVDRQPRLANVKTRLTGNKAGTATTPVKTQKQAAKAAPKKSLPIKKRIPNEKPGNEELNQDSKPRSTLKSKKVEGEPCTSTSTDTIDQKLSECNNETEVDTKLTVKDGKTKAISKMLKSLDIQISGFDNILPPEEKIIEVLKSSISENVKTKSRSSAVKLSNTSAMNKCAAKKEQVEKKAGQSSSNSNSLHASFEQSTKDGAVSKKEVSVGSVSETVASNEDKAFKETSEELEEPIIETKKKIAAKKAKLEANRNKKKQEERKEEDKLRKPQDLHKPLNIVDVHSDQMKDKTEQDKKKHVKPKSSQLATEGEISEDRKGQNEIEASRHMKSAKYCDKESTVIAKDEARQLKKNNTKTVAGFEDPIEKNIAEQVKDEADENKTKQIKSVKEKGIDNSAQRKDEDSNMKKKQIKSSRISQNTNVERESLEEGKHEEIHDKKKTAKLSKFNKKESLEPNKEETEENKKRQIKAGKCSQQNTEVVKEAAVVSVSLETSLLASPKKNKLLKGKCNDDGIKLSQLKIDQEVSSTKELNIKVPSVTFNDTEGSSLKETPKKGKSLTILQRLQNKYKMSPVKSKPLGPVKPTKKVETKSSTKKLHALSAEKQKPNDIYDFKSGSESEENIKMELPTLKKLREFSDDDDKPLQVAKKKVKEDEKVAETISKKPEPKGDTSKIEKSNIKTALKHPVAEKKSGSKVGRKPIAKIKRPPTESSSDEKSSTTTDSEDEQKLSTFGQKRHRMASLNAAAKVQCLYENESRTAYELGLSKTVQIVPKIRNINSGSSSEDEHETKPIIKKEAVVTKKVEILKTEPVEEAAGEEKGEVEVETKRELRNVPGRGMGKHWEFESDTDNEAIFIEKLRLKKKKLQKLKALQAKKDKKEKDKDKANERPEEKCTKPKKTIKLPKKHLKVKIASSDDGSSESSEYEDKKKSLNAPVEKSSSEVKKKRKRELKEELIGDYKGILARKRMASLNASAIVAATYEVERHLDRNFASDCSSFESFPEEEKHISKKSKKQAAVTSQPPPPPTSQTTQVKLDTKDLKEVKEIKIDPSECSDTKDSFNDFKDSLKDIKEATRPTSSLVIVQDTDVTITGVYVNPTTGSSQEAYCKMQYRVQSSVTEERVLRPGSVEPPKSYTPLGALSSMRPPGAATGTDECSTPPISAESAPPIAESINNSIIYQPNDSSHPEPSEHSHYSYHHHMSPSPMSLHPHPADHASQMHHYSGHQLGPDAAPQALSAHHYHTPQQSAQPSSASAQGRCESPVRYGGVYQAQHPPLSITAGGGSSAFCAPPNLQQQQHHDMSGYYQPAGPLISPHVLQPIAAPPQQASKQQSSIQPSIGTKNKLIPNSLDSDPERSPLPPLPSSTSTVESLESDVLITGGDLTTFRYPTQQQSSQQSPSVATQQQSQHQQQQLHQQAVAAAAAAAHQGAPPYPRSMHQMHYTSAYPPNYYSPYPGEAMCYSPPYQPYFPAKVYQSAPPPPSYRRYPPYYQTGPHSGPPPPSDIYEQSPPPAGQASPSGPPSGTQLVPAGPGATHSQHLEHYPGPPGYYSGYSPGGGGQCYTRSPYMEYPPQCPCPMQQSCPKNVHTGPHIGSNTSSNNTNHTEPTINTTISNPTAATAAVMTPAVSANIVNSTISKSAATPNSKSSNSNVLPVSAMLNNGTVPANNSSNQQQQLNISRGPVTNNTSNIMHQQLDAGAATNAHHHFLHHPHHHTLLHHHRDRHVQSCDEIELLKPLKSELKSEDIDVDSKINQYEEDVIQPPTPPLAYEKPIEEAVLLDKESAKMNTINNDVVCTIEAFDLTVSPASLTNCLPTQILVGRKARIGKTMAREMVYAGSAVKHNPVRSQQINKNPIQPQETSTQLADKNDPALNLSSHIHSNNKVDNKSEECVPLTLETKIKSEKIKTEKDDELTIVLPGSINEREYLDKIKTELESSEDIKVSSTESVIDDEIEITSPTMDGPKQRIKILEFHKNQCKKSPSNSYKSLIKQTEPKSYLCLSRKVEKRNRFGKLKKSSRNSVVRKRKLVLTDQQKKSLRLRKKKLIAIEQRMEKIREKKRLAALAQRIERRHAARKEKLKKSLLLNSNRSLITAYEKSNGLVARGYFSEPETHFIPSCATAGRKMKKSKTTEARSKSETKKPSSSLLNAELLDCSSSTSTKTNKLSLNLSGSMKSKTHKKYKSFTINRKNNKLKSQTESSIPPAPLSEVDQNRVINVDHDETLISNNNNSSEANNNDFSKTPIMNPTASSGSKEALSDEAETDSTSLSSNAATLPVPQLPPSEFVFLRPAIPRYIRHNGTMKRIRSRSKFGCRKRPKHKHSISFEVDETIQPTRPDVVPKWNNGWRWEGEPFQGAVFLNSDDPHVIRTCYPAMRHSEGDIIRPRDCVLLKANEDNELPYVAKVAYLWENPEDGEMMMSLLWYYRPEHTEQGRLRNDCPDEVYASRHRDHNSVACIEDKCYVLVFREYCRYRRRLRAAEEDIQDITVVPKRPNFFNPRAVPESTNPELVMFCRRAYEFRTKRLLKMPNKHDNVTRSSN
ncbi:uncharacterized protein LOC129944512 isoform X2 [Eupeodes corollae]|uniref:uncharacterized protein LOC129944512 isoform X2 n=1 Tax=Eupeodes corollae TaxID=290404 RepID=UPI0024918FB7|nr:uncharacterized protein LOC129944512 isoform X2 [Eupeodes corollae]